MKDGYDISSVKGQWDQGWLTRGQIWYRDGTTYEGEIENGMRHGWGKGVYDGTEHDGWWKADEPFAENRRPFVFEFAPVHSLPYRWKEDGIIDKYPLQRKADMREPSVPEESDDEESDDDL